MFKVGDRVTSKLGPMTGVVTGIEEQTGRIIVLTDMTEEDSRVRYAYKPSELRVMRAVRKSVEISVEVEVAKEILEDEHLSSWVAAKRAEWREYEEKQKRENNKKFKFKYYATYLLNKKELVTVEATNMTAIVKLINAEGNEMHVPREQTLGFYYACYGIESIELISDNRFKRDRVIRFEPDCYYMINGKHIAETEYVDIDGKVRLWIPENGDVLLIPEYQTLRFYQERYGFKNIQKMV